jgi:hypothetical protein
VIDLAEIKRVYNAKNHPAVMAGQKTEDQVLVDFLNTFEDSISVNIGDMKVTGNKDGRVSLDEWLAYYTDVSSNIDNDEYFEVMMRNCFDM